MYKSLTNVYNKISALKLPNSWVEEKIEAPNLVAKMNAYASCVLLFNYLKKLPKIVACTKEIGVFISYDKSDINFCIETYNDGDIAVVISNTTNKKIIYSEDIKEFDFIKSVKTFNSSFSLHIMKNVSHETF